MADPENSYARLLNPWALHLQKLGLELKCSLCLNLFNRPLLLPCDHIFCNSCMPESTQFGSHCPLCKVQYLDKEIRPLPFIENVVTIYRSLDATFCASLSHSVSPGKTSNAKRIQEQCSHPVQANDIDSQRKEVLKIHQQKNPSTEPSILLLASTKKVQAPFNYSIEQKVEENDKDLHFSVSRSGEVRGYESCKLTSQLKAEPLEKCRMREIDTNQVAQSSPGSPPSFGDAKGSDDESNNKGSEQIKDKYLARTPGSAVRRGQGANVCPASESVDGHVRDFKRQKKLTYGVDECLLVIGQNLTSDVGLSPAGSGGLSSDPSEGHKFICSFCQTSKLSVATGPMLHYSKGKLVEEDVAFSSSVIHVHRKCFEWAPQVYFVGETVKNLEVELARGAKLKCCSCGLKGAALGCFEKSCKKTFHVPCAVEVLDCRWDCDNFLMLCPTHSSLSFPSEKSKSGKHCSKKSSTEVNFWADSPGGAKEWVLCGSALSAEEKFLLVEFGNMSGVTVSKCWRTNVTHVIAATDANGACSRTLKVLMATLNGRWILKIDWIKVCMEAKRPVDEEPFEVGLDTHGCRDGPRTGRLRVLDDGPKLFDGLHFYFIGDFVPTYLRDLCNLITAAGGAVVKGKEDLLAIVRDALTTPAALVVYNLDPPQGGCELGEEVSAVLRRLEEAEKLCSETGSQVIAHTWLLESIAACKLQPFASPLSL